MSSTKYFKIPKTTCWGTATSNCDCHQCQTLDAILRRDNLNLPFFDVHTKNWPVNQQTRHK